MRSRPRRPRALEGEVRERRRNQSAVAQKPSGPGLDAAGGDIVWTLTSPELYDLLVTRRGWSLDAYQDRPARSLFEALVESGPADSSSGRQQEGRAP